MNDYSTSTLIHEVNAAMDRIAERKLHDTVGISYGRFIFLFIVAQYGELTQHQIAQALKISDPAVSKLCAGAAQDGVIDIATNPQHKRQRLVSLSSVGDAMLQQSLAVLDDCFSDICARAHIDEAAYRDQTTRVLDALNNKYKEILS